MDRIRHEVLVGESPVDLTPLEFRLLALLMERSGRVLTRDHFLERAWGEEVFVTDRSVDTHSKRLRSKLGKAARRLELSGGSEARDPYYYTNGDPRGEIKEFIDFILSSEGQKLVEKVGYVPANPAPRT